MRPQGLRRPGKRATLLLAIVLVAATGGGVLAWAPWRQPAIPAPLDPAIRYTQDATGVHLYLHNRNKHWGLRNQRLMIGLYDERAKTGGFAVIRTYGGRNITTHTAEGDDPRTMQCCVITYLPPGGDYEFHLFPTRSKVYGIDLTLRDGDGWVRMEPDGGP